MKISVSGSPKINPASLAVPTAPESITFTRFTGPYGSRCTKSFSTDAHGQLIKDSAPLFGKGLAETIAIRGLTELPHILDGLSSNQCISNGVFDQQSCSVLTQKSLTPEKVSAGYRARSKQHMTEPKCGLLLIDYDPSPDMPEPLQCNSATDVMNKLIAAIPELKHVGYVGSTSNSAGLYNPVTNEPYPGGGFHIYLAIEGLALSDLKRFFEIKLCNAGLSYIGFARNGAMLKRTLIDLAVLSPERLNYEARPVLGENLAQATREWTRQKGTALSGKLTISDNEEAEYQQRIDAALSAPVNIERSEQLKQVYISNKASEYAKIHDVTNDEARERIAKQVCTLKHGKVIKLYADQVLQVESNQITIGELLKQGDIYDGRYIPDPIEGSGYGVSTAVFNFKGGYTPRITSFAHGQTTVYLLSEFARVYPVKRATAAEPICKGTTYQDNSVTESQIASRQADDQKSNRKTKKHHPLQRYSLLGDTESLEQLSANHQTICDGLMCTGQATVWYAKPNSGKTLITLHHILEDIRANRISGSNCFYLNMDDSAKGLADKNRLCDEYGVNMLAHGHKGFDISSFFKVLEELANSEVAPDTILILDTLTRFVDTIKKTDSRHFSGLIRAFVAKGGSVLALAHTNKNTDDRGKLVPAGVSDILNDFDCGYVIDVPPSDPSTGKKIVHFENIKRRGDVLLEAAYSFAYENKISYEELIASVEVTDIDAVNQIKQVAEQASNAEVIDIVSQCIVDGITTKMKLASEAAKRSSTSKRAVLKLIDKYTGDDPKQHRWQFEVKARGAKHFHLLTQCRSEMPE